MLYGSFMGRLDIPFVIGRKGSFLSVALKPRKLPFIKQH
jgi:hypothetical protein